MTAKQDLVPAVSWNGVEAILMGMANTPDKRLMVGHLVEGTRKQAPFLTPEGVMAELFYLATALLDQDFNPSFTETNSSDASSSSSA
ncbi:hypothetical protein [Brevundimonas goettingensis]|uniref:hypothetical protein n=1 Tax=Brevundimonas goettingensis TaxID=2774190 RepID=UPI001CEC94F3|nr:hypothetical protein [Brevundimonas goettingensis]